MKNEIFGKFRLRLGPETTIYNYWRLKFILSRAKRESFGYLLRNTVSSFKEDAENSLKHMKSLMQLVEPPF